jgi:UDP-GlcNAc:undecaprenyl-phosphate GlcNAc-1-phosphate transferase
LPDEARLIAAFGLALLTSLAVTPLAISVATRADFRDHPAGYKAHAAPTPYLGGAAVFGGFLIAAGLTGPDLGPLLPIVGGMAVLCAIGTLDDLVEVSAGVRLTVEVAAAAALWAFDLGWSVSGSDAVNLALTIGWTVGLTNAFNLIDNADGAAATIGAVTAAGVAALALSQDDMGLAMLCLGLAGACLGFLPYNLSAPARIFLGDGGSLAIGFGLAGAVMALPGDVRGDWSIPLAALLLAGLPVIDTMLVLVSRTRRGLPLFRGGRDHLTHRMIGRLPSPRTVAALLGVVQAVFAAVAVGTLELGEGSVLAAWVLWFLVGAGAVAYAEARLAPAARPPGAPAASPERRRMLTARRSPTSVEVVLAVGIGLTCGLSALFSGFYRLSSWGPVTLAVLAILLGLVLTRPALPRRSAILALLGLAGLWVSSLLSAGWAESVDRALTEGNRWLLYAALLATLVVLLRNDRIARLLLAAVTSGILAVAAGVVAVLLFGDGPGLFLKARLHEPLGFINGQAAVFLLGIWPLVAVAEHAGRRWLAALSLGGAALLGALVLLSQTRSVLPAFAVSAVVLLAFVPGRTVRLLALLALAAAVATFAAPLLDVYGGSAGGDQPPDKATTRLAGLAALGAAAAATALWALGSALAARLDDAGRARASRALVAALVVGALMGGAGLLAAIGDPVDKVRSEWNAFKELESDDDEQSRLTGAGGNRYDYWRIAVEQFRDHPLAGVGAGNYESTYFLERRTDENVTQPHSLEFQTLAELGLVGAALLLLFVTGVLAGLAARIRTEHGSGTRRGLIVAASGIFLVWLVQSSLDWLHLIPGVTGIAICGAAVLVASWAWKRPEASGPMRTVLVAGCALAILLGAFTVGRVTLADRYREQAARALSDDPAEALERANDALDLNGDSLPALYVKAAALARENRYEESRATLAEATRLEPYNHVPWVLLGDLAVRRGALSQARRDYARAARLNPRDPTLQALSEDPLARSSP